MKDSWEEWHIYTPKEEIPEINPSFKIGFLSACNFLLPLLKQSLIHVSSTAEASHLTDGFAKRNKNVHDILEDKIKEILKA